MWDAIKSNPGTAFSIVISIAAFSFSIYSWWKTRTATLYSDIDGRYMELLKLGIANPDFVNVHLTKDYQNKFRGEQLLKYQLYAFAAWNVVETIIDRHGDNNLSKTWDPVIREENRLHRRWLNDKENQHKFKKEFWDFMVGNRAFPCPDCKDGSLCPRCTKLRTMIASKQEFPIEADS